MLPLHVWLPEAHVESSTLGRVILAGLMLKLSLVGMLRLVSPLPAATTTLSPMVATLGIRGLIFSSLAVTRQVDLKRTVAYASVGHMNLTTLSLIWGSHYRSAAAMCMALAHGVVSPGLFYTTGTLYGLLDSRLINRIRSLQDTHPALALTTTLLLLSNGGVPGTISFTPEVVMLSGVAIRST